MNHSNLIYIGIKGSIVALNRANGEKVWATHLTGSDFVNVVLDEGVLLASCRGEVFCLDPLTGNPIWHNPLKGFGLGLASIVTPSNPGSTNEAILAEEHRQDESRRASSTAVAAV